MVGAGSVGCGAGGGRGAGSAGGSGVAAHLGGKEFGRDVQEIFLAYLIGRSHVGMRTYDVATWSEFLSTYRTGDDKPRIQHLVAIGEAAIPALHAAALWPDRFTSVELKNMVRSWAHVVRAPETLDQAVNVVHGALRHYDLPDLVELAGAGKVRVLDPVDVLGKPLVANKRR